MFYKELTWTLSDSLLLSESPTWAIKNNCSNSFLIQTLGMIRADRQVYISYETITRILPKAASNFRNFWHSRNVSPLRPVCSWTRKCCAAGDMPLSVHKMLKRETDLPKVLIGFGLHAASIFPTGISSISSDEVKILLLFYLGTLNRQLSPIGRFLSFSKLMCVHYWKPKPHI